MEKKLVNLQDGSENIVSLVHNVNLILMMNSLFSSLSPHGFFSFSSHNLIVRALRQLRER